MLMSKNDQDGQTVLMLAAASGDTGVFKAVASKLPRAQVSNGTYTLILTYSHGGVLRHRARSASDGN